ncbi:hypothetical protein L6164_020970 [Bauhinia variegata]|uniref:Uncharacterized protein n=1 Tax=Bauhinia variegata TaxID=167791 RepID=A0ACB9MX26_BAUVA|nr:hypothetical protein L6164_020970 [Bauhinia variegata]
MNPDQCGLKCVRLRGLYKLKKFVAIRIEEIDVDAPNLEDFQYEAAFVDFPLKINVDKCRNLRGIDLSSLHTIIITNQWLFELFRKFHLLERLRLHECMFSERVKVSCDSLKVLEMSNYLNLNEVIIDAPNLCSLKICTSVEMPILTFLKISSLTYFEIILRFRKYWDFQKLREFLQGFEYRDILASLSLHIGSLSEFNPDILRVISVSLPSIKHLNLITSPWFKTPRLHLVSGLLWSCPATISIQVEHRISYSVVEILKKVLIDRKQDAVQVISNVGGIV